MHKTSSLGFLKTSEHWNQESLDLEMFSIPNIPAFPLIDFPLAFFMHLHAHRCFWEPQMQPLNPWTPRPLLSLHMSPCLLFGSVSWPSELCSVQKTSKSFAHSTWRALFEIRKGAEEPCCFIFCCHSKFCRICSMELFRPNRKLTESRLQSFQAFYSESKWFLAAPKKHRKEHVTMLTCGIKSSWLCWDNFGLNTSPRLSRFMAWMALKCRFLDLSLS